MRRECASELYSNSLQLSGFRILAVEEGRKQRDPDLAGAHEVSNPRVGGIRRHDVVYLADLIWNDHLWRSNSCGPGERSSPHDLVVALRGERLQRMVMG